VLSGADATDRREARHAEGLHRMCGPKDLTVVTCVGRSECVIIEISDPDLESSRGFGGYNAAEVRQDRTKGYFSEDLPLNVFFDDSKWQIVIASTV
jgi:hypothetical protein